MTDDSQRPQLDAHDIESRAQALTQALAEVQSRIEAAGGNDVSLLPVSKGHPAEACVAALHVGLSCLGENYAQELVAKAGHVDAGIEWHFIGQLQTNKVRQLAPHVAVWQSVDRLKVAREIAKRAPGAQVLGQVNLSSEPQKAGCAFDELDPLIDAMRELDLDVRGLMGVGTAGDERDTAAGFARLRAACDQHDLPVCSMGMTADLELAIREGSTMVRVGSALFGARP